MLFKADVFQFVMADISLRPMPGPMNYNFSVMFWNESHQYFVLF